MEQGAFFSDISRQLIAVSLPLGVFSAVFFVVCILRALIFRNLDKIFKEASPTFNRIIISSVKSPSWIWGLMLSLFFALQVSSFSEHTIDVISKSILVLGIISVTFVAGNIAGEIVQNYSQQIETTLPVTSLTQHFIRLIIFVIGGLVILNSLGISIAPLLATLGVGGLAVALALQDTLANLFAGIHIMIARQIRIGDFIKLESGEEGYVVDINWRTTKVRLLLNNEVLIPNSKLSQAVITNYHLPDTQVAVPVQVGVHYNSDLKKVEEVSIAAAKEVMKNIPGGVPSFEPVVRFHTFADFSINFAVILRASEASQRGLIQHEFIKKLVEYYRREGIVIPYPIQAVDYEQEKAYKLFNER